MAERSTMLRSAFVFYLWCLLRRDGIAYRLSNLNKSILHRERSEQEIME